MYNDPNLPRFMAYLSLFTSFMNFGDYGMAIVSGTLLVILGYQRFFLYAAWIVGPALLILYFVKQTKK